MHKLLILLVLLTQGCSTVTPYAEGFIGYKVRGQDGLKSCSRENAGVRLGVEREVTEHFIVGVEYEHISHLLCGRPFNEDVDDSTDHIGAVLRYEW